MAHVEPMEIDCAESEFENKENSIHHSNVLPRTPCTEKGYEELDVSELNMKLRYSITPASSPNMKSFIGNYTNKNTDVLDNKSVIDNINLTHSLNSTLTSNDNNKSSKLCPLQVLPTEQKQDSNRQVLSRKSLGVEVDNNITITVGENMDENLSFPSTSSSIIHTPEATTPTKELPKDGGSPIMRGLRSVLSMFRPSQSPIPPYDIGAQDNSIESHSNKLDEPISHPTQVSTPIANKTTRSSSKRNSPHKESLTFNEDLEKELLWKDETTILFKDDKIPIHKLLQQQPISSNLETKLLNNTKEELHKSVEYMDISYNDSVVNNKNNLYKTSKIDSSVLESDSEFVDCESTYTNIHIESHSKIIDKTETIDQVDDVNDYGHQLGKSTVELGQNYSLNVTMPIESFTTNSMDCASQIIKYDNNTTLANDKLCELIDDDINLSKVQDEKVVINTTKDITDNKNCQSLNAYCNNTTVDSIYNKTVNFESEHLNIETAIINIDSPPTIASFENSNHKLIVTALPITDKPILQEHEHIEDTSVIDNTNNNKSKPELTLVNPADNNVVTTDSNVPKIINDENVRKISDNEAPRNVDSSETIIMNIQEDKKTITDNVLISHVNDDLVVCKNQDHDLISNINIVNENTQNPSDNIKLKADSNVSLDAIQQITQSVASENNHEIVEKGILFGNEEDNNIETITNNQEVAASIKNDLLENVLNRTFINDNIIVSKSNCLSKDKCGEYEVVSSNTLSLDEYKYCNLPTDVPLPSDNEFEEENAHSLNLCNDTREVYPLNITEECNENYKKKCGNICENIQNTLNITQTNNESKSCVQSSDAELHFDSRKDESFSNVLTLSENPNIVDNDTSIYSKRLITDNEIIIQNKITDIENNLLQDANVDLLESCNVNINDKSRNSETGINLEENDEVVISENASLDNLLPLDNSFDTEMQIGRAHPSSPLANKKGYDINFEDIDDPFTTKTKIRLSPTPENSSNTLFKPILDNSSKNKNSIQKKKEHKDKRKSQKDNNVENHTKNLLNNTFDKTDVQSSEKDPISDHEIEKELSLPMIVDNEEKTESSLEKLSPLMESTTPSLLEKTVDNKNNNKNFEENNSENETTNVLQPMTVDSVSQREPSYSETFNPLIEDAITQSRLEKPVANKNNNGFFEESNFKSENTNISEPMLSIETKAIINHPEITKTTFKSPEDKLNTEMSNIIILPNKDTNVVEEMPELKSYQTYNKDEKESSPNISNATLGNLDRDSTKGVNTEDEDTVEGPFIESEDITDLHDNLDYLDPVKDMVKFEDLPSAVDNDNEENGEIFIDAEAFEFLLNQNKSNVIADSGKESLFLKFDPLFAKRVSSDGIIAALKKVQNKQSTPKKLSKFPSEENHNMPESVPFKTDSTFEDENDDNGLQSISKPMMVVSPAVSSIVSPKKATTPKVNRQSLTFTSPAMAVIDRLLSLSGNMTIIDQNTSISSPNRQHNETDLAITQLREMLAEKEIHVHNLRSETKDLQIRLATMEAQVKTLEGESEERLRKVKDLNERLVEKTKINKSMAIVVEEYERTIASLILEMQQERKNNEAEKMTLIKERDEQTAHLASMEVSFTDLHSKYEKSKQIILSMKANEDTYRKSIKEFEENLLKMQNNYELLKQHATSKLNHANQELEKFNRAHEAEVLKYNALIKRKELHITSLEETLTQKTKANEELTAICDELINKVG